MAPLVLYPMDFILSLRTECGPLYAQTTHSTLINSGPGEVLNYTFQTSPPMRFSQGV